MIIPLDAADIPNLKARTLEMPARLSTGVSCLDLEPGTSRWEMDTAEWLIGDDGDIAIGALGVLVDACLGTAVMSGVSRELSMVTSHLQMEALVPLDVDMSPFICTGRPTALEDRFALGAADITAADGRIVARASMGSVMFAVDGDHAVAPHAAARDGDLDMAVVAMDADTLRTSTPAHPWLANNYGGIHGGAGFLIGERTMQLALDAVDGVPMRAVEVRAAFLRKIPADGHPIEGIATVVHRGRRLGAARGEVRTHDGKAAVLVDATYIPA